MFHTQRLSLQLSDLFHRPPIYLASLTPHLQTYIRNLLKIPEKANPKIRPSQATTPMGFRLSVDIGHFTAKTLISRSLKNIRYKT